jgi:ribosome-associated translation inhibitor RaiA
MYTEDVIVNYKGFKPSQNTEAELKKVTDYLHEVAPSESSLNATFTKARGNKYQGMIRINFSEGSFFARAKDYDLESVIVKIVQRLREQLNRWKTLRFDEPGIMIEGDLSYGTSH